MVRNVGIPAIDIWAEILDKSLVVNVLEDNQALIETIRTGRNPTMRHFERTHRVPVAWLHELYQANTCSYDDIKGIFKVPIPHFGSAAQVVFLIRALLPYTTLSSMHYNYKTTAAAVAPSSPHGHGGKSEALAQSPSNLNHACGSM